MTNTTGSSGAAGRAGAADTKPQGPGKPDEAQRVANRREKLSLPTENAVVKGRWALALSGGGIRSATLSLGVLQALARRPPARAPAAVSKQAAPPAPASPAPVSPAPESPAAAPSASDPSSEKASVADSLLFAFDYLSTVSGGGYVGSFLCSLFVPGRLRAETAGKPADAARDALETMAYEPPTRIRSATDYGGEHIYSAPTAWLRESGRYLTPTGAGDLLYAAALTIRNWFAVQYVLGTLLLTAFLFFAFLRSKLAELCPWFMQLELRWWCDAIQSDPMRIWWSPVWGLVALVFALWLLPLGIAYWLTYPDAKQTEGDPPNMMSRAVGGVLVVAVLLLVPAYVMWYDTAESWRPVARLAAVAGVYALFALLLHLVTLRFADSIVQHRVHLTRWLASGLSLTIVLALLAASDTISQGLYLMLTDNMLGAMLTPAGLLGAGVWLVRHLAQLFEGKEKPTWFAKISLNLLAGVGGTLMFLLVATLWALLVQWIRWFGDMPSAEAFKDPMHVSALGWGTLVMAGLSWISAQFPAFINLSTLQSFYGTRLTRAYLGASNRERFAEGSASQAARSVAEPLKSDQLSRTRYYADDVLAPLHLINVTLNQTVDPAEQLVQRDRKGLPLCVGPTGFAVDGWPNDFRDDGDATLEQDELTVGQWIGTSGAAVTTGLGRSTSLGFSLVLGLANLRLGTWWRSGCGKDRSPWYEHWFKAVYRTQTFLLYELMGRFYGMHREWQYLSDGGHFENTAVYELLRPERKVGLIVACDNGCDGAYRFGDFANLIRLARIDHRIEIEVDTAIAKAPVLSRVFGTPEDFAPNKTESDKCALLLNVYRAEGGNAPACRIIVLKPRRLKSAPVDVKQYAATHPTFPQETTADQFFDEAQWESYRRLGYATGMAVFGASDAPIDPGVGDALWEYLARPVAAAGVRA